MKSLLLLFACFALLATSPAQKPAPIILILDGSGSMWGQIEGTTKIEIARQVVGDVVANLPDDQPIGMVVYGHRSKGDCADIEEVVPVGTGNRGSITTSLDEINPIGKTPLAATATRVIEQLKIMQTQATIILVSDGAESCGGDLCEVIKKAKEAGVEFVLHVVGFDMGESDKLALECAARAGEGNYLDATNAEELGAALQQATTTTVEDETTNYLVKVTKAGELIDAIVKIYSPDLENPIANQRTYRDDKTNPTAFFLTPGVYDIYAKPIKGQVTAKWVRGATVETQKNQSMTIDFSAGQVSIKTTSNGELWNSSIRILPAGEKSNGKITTRTYANEKGNPAVKELTPGKYDIYLRPHNLSGVNIDHVIKGVEIAAGEDIELSHAFDIGQLSIGTTHADDLWDSSFRIFHKESNKNIATGRTYKGSKTNPAVVNLIPGTYTVRLKAQIIEGACKSHQIQDVLVGPDQLTEINHIFTSGVLELSTKHGGDMLDCTVRIKDVDTGNFVATARTYDKIKSFQLCPGNYKVSIKPLKVDAKPVEIEVTLQNGQKIQREFSF